MSQKLHSVTELFLQYLHRQKAAQTAGLGLADPDGQVVPHEAAPLRPVDPQLAWDEALAAGRLSKKKDLFSRLTAPPEWPGLVAAQGPAFALAFCIGNFPQMVRHVQPLLAGGDLPALRPTAARPIPLPTALVQWTNAVQDYSQLLTAAAVLRLAQRFEEAHELLRSSRSVPEDWQPLWANEEAALAWHRGHAEEAWARWQTQKISVPVRFNCGMAALFLNRPAEAQIALEQAVAQLPDTSAWHHLGRLYLALIAASV
jgi:tetratricopeptide (TPR) repeat protein